MYLCMKVVHDIDMDRVPLGLEGGGKQGRACAFFSSVTTGIDLIVVGAMLENVQGCSGLWCVNNQYPNTFM